MSQHVRGILSAAAPFFPPVPMSWLRRRPLDLLDPKNDAVFKLMLVDDDAAEVRISLLSAILRPESPITSATVKNPQIPKKYIRDKDTILDILIELNDGKRIDLEMQMAWNAYIPERAYFYGSKLMPHQLGRGQKYETLKPASVIFLLNSIGFKDAPPDEAHYVFTMKERANLTRIPPLLAMHFIEIPKLIGILQPENGMPKDLPFLNWCKFLYNPSQPGLDGVINSMPALKKAKKKLEEISADEEKREIARMRERGRRDYESDMSYFLNRGREEGRAEGEAKGELAAKNTILASLLASPLAAKISNHEIAKICGLSEAEVERARRKSGG